MPAVIVEDNRTENGERMTLLSVMNCRKAIYVTTEIHQKGDFRITYAETIDNEVVYRTSYIEHGRKCANTRHVNLIMKARHYDRCGSNEVGGSFG